MKIKKKEKILKVARGKRAVTFYIRNLQRNGTNGRYRERYIDTDIILYRDIDTDIIL